MAERRLLFREVEADHGDVRLEWADGDWAKFDPLDFWIVPSDYTDTAKDRVRSGEFDG